MTSFSFARHRRLRLVLVVLAAAAIGFPLSGNAAVAEDLFPELAGLLRDALTQSPRILAVNLDRLQAEQSLLSSNSALYPQVSFGGTYNYQYERRSSGATPPGQAPPEWETNNRYNASLSASYPLIQWGAVRAGVEYGRIQADIAAKNVVQAYRGLALEIRRAFLQAIIDKTSVRAARFSDEMVRRGLANLEAQVEAGQASPSALGSARLGVDESALVLDRSIRTFEQQVRALQRLTGRMDLTKDSIPDAIPDVTRIASEETATRLDDYVGQRRFEFDGQFEILNQQLESEKRTLHIAKVSQRPKVNLVSGGSIDQLTYVNDIGQRTGVSALFVGLSVGWNIFDGFATRGRVLTSLTRLRALETRRARLEEDLRDAANQAGTELNFASRALTLSEGRFNSTKGLYDHVAEQVARQQVAPDALDNTRLTLNSQELALFAARRDYLNAVAAWLFTLNADPAVPASIPAPSP